MLIENRIFDDLAFTSFTILLNASHSPSAECFAAERVNARNFLHHYSTRRDLDEQCFAKKEVIKPLRIGIASHGGDR